MARENAEFYGSKSKIHKRLGKIKTNVRTSSNVILSIMKSDYSGKRLPLSWDTLPSRFDLINRLIAVHHYESYLEIGCSTDACFQNIASKSKIGVDPFSGGTHRMTSDEFFAQNKQTFDVIFVDGLHQYAQVKKDVLNSIQVLKEDGVILVHDCLPLTYRAQLPFPSGGAWNGDVWKALVEIRTHEDMDAAVCLIDQGVGIVKKRRNQNLLKIHTYEFINLRFKDFVERYAEWLNTITYDQAERFSDA